MPEKPNISDIRDFQNPRGARRDLIHDIGVSLNPKYWRYTKQNIEDIKEDVGRLRHSVGKRINRFFRRG